VKNRFQSFPFKFNLQRYTTEMMQPLLDPMKKFAALDYEGKRDCLIAWATVVFTVTSAPSLDVGLMKGGEVRINRSTHRVKPFYLSSETVLPIK
jgi:hypothetical protein